MAEKDGKRIETLAVRVPKADGQAIKERLKAEGLLDHGFEIKKENDHLVLPVTGKINGLKTEKIFLKARKHKPRTFREALLREGASEELVNGIARAFDLVGGIAVLEPWRKLTLEEEKLVANALLAVHPNIETVCVKEGIVQTEYRVRPVRVIAGKKSTRTLHTEFGCRMWIDVARAYFSPRYSPERLRVTKQVEKGENVCVMFAGVGPYALLIAQEQPTAKVWAVEINPQAVKLLEENVKLNKCEGKITSVLGDVRVTVPKSGKKFDRIIMPLPKSAQNFLDVAIAHLKPGGTIHFYQFLQETDFFKPAENLVNAAAKAAGRRAKILYAGKCGRVAPGRFRIVVDARID